jgi:hypothetical protein
MKYLEILKQKSLSVENLPKVLQKKIQELDFQYNELKKFENDEELDEEDLEDVEIVKQKIDELDSHIAHKVKIFDQVKYQQKLDKINLMSKAKKQKEDVVEKIEVKQEFAEPKVQVQVQEPQVQVQEPQLQVQEPQVQKEQVTSRQPIQVNETEEVGYEEEEFEKVGEGKPKKMTTGLILMGVGAFFLTWGAVNFFKSRR